MRMNKRIVLVIALLFITTVLTSLFVVTASAATGNTAEFEGGTGTEADPYLIETKEHLNNVRNDLEAYYKLVADIVFTEADFAANGDFYNDASGFVPIGTKDATLCGSFDGNVFIQGINPGPRHVHNIGRQLHIQKTVADVKIFVPGIEFSSRQSQKLVHAVGVFGQVRAVLIDNFHLDIKVRTRTVKIRGGRP